MRDIGRESYLKRRDQLLMQDERIAKLEAELHGTVTTKYHDKIVAEAMQRIGKLQAENNKLQALNAQLQAEVDDIPFRYIEGSSYAGFCQVNKEVE